MNVRDLIDRARNGNDYACGAIYAICDGDPVKLTELGEDIATAVNNAHERALARHSNPVRAEEIAEYARLTAVREGRRASFMSDKISMDEAREKVRAENAADEPEIMRPFAEADLAPYITKIHEMAVKLAEKYEDPRYRYAIPVHHLTGVENAADLSAPRIP